MNRVGKHGFYDQISETFTLAFKGLFPLRAWKRAFFVSFIDLRLKRAVKIEVSAKKINKTKKRMLFSTLVVETGLKQFATSI